MTRPLHTSELRYAVLEARSLFIAVDLDGSLGMAGQWSRTFMALQRLALAPKVALAVLSRRELSELQGLLDIGAIFVGAHGLEIDFRTHYFTHPETERLVRDLEHACVGVLGVLERWPKAFVQNKRLTATIHLHDYSDAQRLSILRAVREFLASYAGSLGVRCRRTTLEIVPEIGWDKGSALKYLERNLGIHDALTVCIGDQETDETMFRAFPSAVNIRVSPGIDSVADYSLPDTAALTDLVEWLADTVGAAPRASTLCRLPRGGVSHSARI